jgi:hypothetical protein
VRAGEDTSAGLAREIEKILGIERDIQGRDAARARVFADNAKALRMVDDQLAEIRARCDHPQTISRNGAIVCTVCGGKPMGDDHTAGYDG